MEKVNHSINIKDSFCKASLIILLPLYTKNTLIHGYIQENSIQRITSPHSYPSQEKQIIYTQTILVAVTVGIAGQAVSCTVFVFVNVIGEPDVPDDTFLTGAYGVLEAGEEAMLQSILVWVWEGLAGKEVTIVFVWVPNVTVNVLVA